MIKAVFLDFDGTIYSHASKSIPDSAIFAMKKARENGIKIFTATGRAFKQLGFFDLKGLKFDGHVLNNGQVLLDQNNQIIDIKYIEGSAKEKIVNLYKEKRLGVMMTGYDYIHLNFLNDFIKEAYESVGSPISEIVPYNNEDFIMATIFASNQKEKEELKQYSDILSISWWHPMSIDVFSKDTNKLEGIKKIIKHYDINLDETLAIGDGNNDSEMLESCGYGIAMGNSNKELFKYSDYITTDIDDDGIYNAFKHCGLI